jgi:hypothetical protein
MLGPHARKFILAAETEQKGFLQNHILVSLASLISSLSSLLIGFAKIALLSNVTFQHLS